MIRYSMTVAYEVRYAYTTIELMRRIRRRDALFNVTRAEPYYAINQWYGNVLKKYNAEK